MDFHRQQLVKGKRYKKSSGMSKRSSRKTALKVVYISTPMKVTTSASKFRETVQELTGRESDVVRIMETCGGQDSWLVPDDHHRDNHSNSNKRMISTSTERSSPSTSTDELVGPFNGVFVRGQESNFGFFDHTSVFDQFFHQLDVLGTY